MPARSGKKGQPRWARYSDEQLLDVRFCDLRLSLKRAPISAQLDRLHRELESRGLSFRPHMWLSNEWFSPDGIPGFAIPFYLAHPRLARLERKMMQEVEGGNANWLMRILRHETGHALDTAYRVRRRKEWRRTFGKASRAYPRIYRPRPASRNFVLHLGQWYAQTHPTEDFAETFAVWLQPRSRWRRQYADWPALDKLQYVDRLMAEIAQAAPAVRNRAIIDPLRDNKRTLRDHYRREFRRYAIEATDAYDRRLLRVFARKSGARRRPSASALLRAERSYLVRKLARDTGIHAYLIYNTLRALLERCRTLDLVMRKSRRESRRELVQLVERIVFDTLRDHRQQYAL